MPTRSAISSRHSSSRVGSVIARTSGSRSSEMTYALTMLGRWDEALVRIDGDPGRAPQRDIDVSSVVNGVVEFYLHRGQLERGA